MEEFLTLIKAEIDKLGGRIYQEIAPKGGLMPYAVYTLPSVNQEVRSDYTLEIEVFGRDKQETEVNNLISELRKLNNVRVFGEGVSFRIKSSSGTFMIPEQDTTIVRRMLTFQLLTYFR